MFNIGDEVELDDNAPINHSGCTVDHLIEEYDIKNNIVIVDCYHKYDYDFDMVDIDIGGRKVPGVYAERFKLVNNKIKFNI